VELKDLRGDLQMHTNATDGKGTIDEMAEAARQLGYEYIAITDHSKRVTMALGLDPKRPRAQWKTVDTRNAQHKGPTILNGRVPARAERPPRAHGPPRHAGRGGETKRRALRAIDRQPSAEQSRVHEVRGGPGAARGARGGGYPQHSIPGRVSARAQEGGQAV